MLKEAIRPVLLAILSFSIVINVGFGAYAYYHNFGLHLPGYQRPTPSDPASDRAPIRAGMKAPSVLAKDRSDATKTITFSFDGQPTVLYVLSPQCRWCARNTANMQALYEQRKSAYRFIGLSLDGDGLASYLSKHSLPFEVYVVDPSTIKEYGLGATPATIVIGADGVIGKKFSGAFLKSLSAVNDFFKVNLPGLNEAG